jgi:hypothetical protein
MTSTRYEYLITGDEGALSVYGSGSPGASAMMFTPSIPHIVTSVNVLLYRVGSPGTLNVSIRNTSANLPTGSDLCIGTTNGNTLPTGSPYEWRRVYLGSGTPLNASTKYAIVIYGPNIDVSNDVFWRCSIIDIYAGGSSANWRSDVDTWFSSANDKLFEEYEDTAEIFAGIPLGLIKR